MTGHSVAALKEDHIQFLQCQSLHLFVCFFFLVITFLYRFKSTYRQHHFLNSKSDILMISFDAVPNQNSTFRHSVHVCIFGHSIAVISLPNKDNNIGIRVPSFYLRLLTFLLNGGSCYMINVWEVTPDIRYANQQSITKLYKSEILSYWADLIISSGNVYARSFEKPHHTMGNIC